MRIEILDYTPCGHKTVTTFTVLVKPSLFQWLLGQRTTKSTFKRIGSQWVEYQPNNIRFKCDDLTAQFFDIQEEEMERAIKDSEILA